MPSFRSSYPLLLAWFLSFVIAGAICFGQAAGDVESKLEELSSQAQAAQQRGDYASAAKAYEQLAQFRPDLGQIWANAGLMHQFLNDYSRADHDFQVALRKNSKLYVPNLFLGLNRLRLHQPGAALPYLKTAAALNPEDEQAALGLGRAYAGIRDYGNAARWFERARRINPMDPDAWYELGVSYLNLQDAAASELKELDPEEVHARTLVADSFLEQGRPKDAIQIYEKFRTQDHPPCLRSTLGFAYIQLDSMERAKEAFQEEIDKRSGCLLAKLGMARVALSGGDIGKMLRQLHEVDELESDFLQSYLPQVWGSLDPEQLKSVVTELQKPAWNQDPMAARVVESATSGSSPLQAGSNPARQTSGQGSDATATPEELWTQGRYGACAEKLENLKNARTGAHTRLLEQCAFYAGDYRLALDTSLHALETSSRNFESLYWQAKAAQELSASSFAQMNAVAPDSPKVHLLMAELHRAREEYAPAEAEYNEVLKSASSEGEAISAHLGLAYIHFHNLEDDKVFNELQPALKSDSSNAEANSLLGQVLVRRHQYQEAIPHLKLALRGASPSSLPEVHSLLSKCYAEQGEYTQAVEELKPTLSADTLGAFHYQLYQVYLKMGDQKSAAAALQKSEQLRQSKSEAEQKHMLSGEQ